MSVSLQKGQKISLTKEKAGLNKVIIGLGWDEVKKSKGFFSMKSANIDCDASAFVLKDGKLVENADVVYFGNRLHKSSAIHHMGDNLTGAGDGDDEQIVVELNSLPQDYDKIVFVVNIYEAVSRKQHFGLIQNAFIRLVDARTNQELCKYNLTDNYDGMTALIFGEVYRYNDEWKFSAIGQGTNDTGVSQLASRFK